LFQTVFALSDQHHLFRSVDAGFTWTSQRTKLDSASGIASMHVSPADPSVIFFLGTERVHWVTRDLGESYEQVKHSERLAEVHLHPTQSGWLLAGALSTECDHPEDVPTVAPTEAPADPSLPVSTSAPPPVDCHRQLLLSQDYGHTWKDILDYVVQFEWAPKGRPDKLIFATALREKHGKQAFGQWDANCDLIKSDDFFQTNSVVLEHANRMLFSRVFLFVATVDPLNPTHVTLRVNRDNATTTLFEKLELPVELTQHSYSLLDSSEGCVLSQITTWDLLSFLQSWFGRGH
jgi:hypothetical protein